MKRSIIPIIALIFFPIISTSSLGQPSVRHELQSIIDYIARINEVQYERIGHGGRESENFKNYLKLRDSASTEELLQLVKHSNPVVACYAGWALVDKGYDDLPRVYNYFLMHDRSVTTFSGCIKDRDSLSSEFYHKCMGIPRSQSGSDSILFRLDSLTLYSPNAPQLLIDYALSGGLFLGRKYPDSYRERIEHLAFIDINKAAIDYLSEWHKSEYSDRIKTALLDYFERTDFRDVGGINQCFDLIKELLEYDDSSMHPIIIQKMKEDRFWDLKSEWADSYFKSRKDFLELLHEHGIDETFE